MLADYLAQARRDPPLAAAAIVAIIGALTICGFFFFQYVLGYPPCPLCSISARRFTLAFRWPRCSGSAVVTAPRAKCWLQVSSWSPRHALEYRSFGLSRRHRMEILARAAGLQRADQRAWLGRQYVEAAQNIRIVRCDEAGLALFGLSLAGYDVLVSLFLAVIAAWGAKAAWARPKTE